jgi:hypothetical protein
LDQWKLDTQARPVAATVMVVEAFIATGRKDDALDLLDKSCREHSNLVTTIKVEPALDPLRGDPRFQELLRNVGLQAAKLSIPANLPATAK